MNLTERLERMKCLDALQLKCIAMALMLCDHAWSTVVPGMNWLTAIGRMAFPIFAFQLVEGFFRTHDRKKYLKRMFLFALISEIPFNLITEGGIFNPFHQNVLFSFCLSLLAMMALEKAREKEKWVFALSFLGVAAVGYLLGFVTFVDYFGYGILTVLVFYLFRGRRFGWLGELVCLFYINWEMIGGLVYEFPIGEYIFVLPEQGLAVLALIPIWLYNGKPGPRSKTVQYACYAFYPAHMLALYLLALLLG